MLTAEQIQERRYGIGSSEIAAILGESRFSDPHKVWLSKVGETTSEESEPMWWGSQLEELIGRRYTKATFAKLERQKIKRLVLPCGKETVALASPDFVIRDAGGAIEKIVECKAVFRTTGEWSPSETEGVPPEYWLQGQWQCGVFGVPRFDLAVFLASLCEFRIYQYEAEPEMFGEMLKVAEHFWAKHVVTGEPPPVSDSKHCKRALELRYPQRAPLKDAPPEALDIIKARLDADARLTQAEKDRDLATNQLREMIGEAEGIIGPWGYVTWKTNARGVRSCRVQLKKGIEL